MRFQFESNQDHQLRAIEAVAGVFEGQIGGENSVADFVLSGGYAAVPNRLDLDEGLLLKNLQAVQQQNGLEADTSLATISETIDTAVGARLASFPNLSV